MPKDGLTLASAERADLLIDFSHHRRRPNDRLPRRAAHFEAAVRFTARSGRYMYHCHILEHEDRAMMRSFVTMPPELMPFVG